MGCSVHRVNGRWSGKFKHLFNDASRVLKPHTRDIVRTYFQLAELCLQEVVRCS